MGKCFFKLIACSFPSYAISYPNKLETRHCVYLWRKF